MGKTKCRKHLGVVEISIAMHKKPPGLLTEGLCLGAKRLPILALPLLWEIILLQLLPRLQFLCLLLLLRVARQDP